MNQTTLFRYNFRVMMLNNWLLLAFPIAVSQLTVFWLILTRRFSSDLPAACVEMVTPILAAFLGAHLLSTEYRTRVGAILASRPVNIGRIVLMRLTVMLSLVWSLAILSLLAFRFMMQPFDLLPAFLACVPSTLFLTMVALTFATLFRQSLAGFAVAAVYWSLDLVPGLPIQPYLSLKSLSSYYAVQNNPLLQTFLTSWWIAKAVLLVGAILLYFFHDRLVFSVGSQLTVSLRRRAAIAAAAAMLVYLLSGAIIKVTYGYSHRGALPRGDLAWFRTQMAPFGPIPVVSLFGPSFRSYIGDIGNPWRISGGDEADLLGNTDAHKRAMHSALDRSPDGLWAPSLADGLAQLEAHGDLTPDGVVAYYRSIVNRYPSSPYCQNALREIARTYSDANRTVDARAAYEELLKRWPENRFLSEAYRFLFESERDAHHLAQAQQWAEKWSAVAPVLERFEALIDVAELRQQNGDMEGARRAAHDTLAAVAAFDSEVAAETITLTPAQTITRKQLARKAEQQAKAIH